MKNLKIVLASNSPRRKELLGMLDMDFDVRVLPGIDESYPHDLPPRDVAQYIACRKAEAYDAVATQDELVITADTVVICDEEIMGKPHNEADARRMLKKLSGRTHQVVTGVCLSAKTKRKAFSVCTDVTFDTLSDEEIDYYVTHYHPFDKAGAYGIQEWIGCVAVSRLEGSYFNVVGFPVQRIYKELKDFIDD